MCKESFQEVWTRLFTSEINLDLNTRYSEQIDFNAMTSFEL